MMRPSPYCFPPFLPKIPKKIPNKKEPHARDSFPKQTRDTRKRKRMWEKWGGGHGDGSRRLMSMGMGIHAYGEYTWAWMAYDHGHMGLSWPKISIRIHGCNMLGHRGSKLLLYIYETLQEWSFDHICNLYASKTETHYNILKKKEKKKDKLAKFDPSFGVLNLQNLWEMMILWKIVYLNGCFERNFSIDVSCFHDQVVINIFKKSGNLYTLINFFTRFKHLLGVFENKSMD